MKRGYSVYPRLRIDKKKFEHNVRYMQNLCHQKGLSMMAVTKVFCADPPLIELLNKIKVDYIADSRMENLMTVKSNIPKVLLRIPSIHEVDRVVKYTDISLNSELVTLEALDKAASKISKVHNVIIMVDIGDLREGLYYKERILEALRVVKSLKNINIKGIGTNLTCYGGIIPSVKTLQKLIDIIKMSEQMVGIKFDIVSGGNSSHIHLLMKNQDVEMVNNLRLGESLILGRETAYGDPIEKMFQDVVTLEADLIEIKQKPSIPEGDIGMNAFGQKPSFEDLGLMKRGIIAIGKQDVDYHEITPMDTRIRLVGSSSDHIIVDLTQTQNDYKIGDVIQFKLSYGSLLSTMTSKYVEKAYE